MTAVGITDRAIEQLRTLIASGDLSPGDRLPAEPDLAAQLGISRGTVREAVRALTHAGVLSVRRGDGTYVTGLEPHKLLEGIAYAAKLAREDTIMDVVEVRRLLEPAATGLAATRISDNELSELAQLLVAMETATPGSLIALDVEFHDRIAVATGNEWLAAILRGLAEPTIAARQKRLTLSPDSVAAVTRREHQEILDALTHRDSTVAEAAALRHVYTTQRGLRAMLAGAGPA